ncbi:MAG: hypothetical protein MUP70_06125 [Candidatus Aminicenantes bacterium]|nr:hypothetical protein [Candidatus Aminicenantes bacterium]
MKSFFSGNRMVFAASLVLTASFLLTAATVHPSFSQQTAQEKKKEEEGEEILSVPQNTMKNPLMPGRTHEIRVWSNEALTDTGFSVFEGQTVLFRSSGDISLQIGNPIAYCGPGGMDYSTVQKWMKDHNIGSLIAKVVKLISVETDEETGEEKRNEKSVYFFIGRGTLATIPMDGRLYLGVNDIVFPDNEGYFQVTFGLR